MINIKEYTDTMNSCTKIIINSEVYIDTSDLSINNSITGKLIRLRPLPFKVLIYLHAKKGKCITRNELFSECWNGAIVSDQALTNVISNLRKSLIEVNAYNVNLKTVSKVGYILEHKDIDQYHFCSETGRKDDTDDLHVKPTLPNETKPTSGKSSKILYIKEKLWRLILMIIISLTTFILPTTPPLANTKNLENNSLIKISNENEIPYYISGHYTDYDIRILQTLISGITPDTCEAKEVLVSLLKSKNIKADILVTYNNRSSAKLNNYKFKSIGEVFQTSKVFSLCNLAL